MGRYNGIEDDHKPFLKEGKLTFMIVETRRFRFLPSVVSPVVTDRSRRSNIASNTGSIPQRLAHQE